MIQFCVYWFENGSQYIISGNNSKADVKKYTWYNAILLLDRKRQNKIMGVKW